MEKLENDKNLFEISMKFIKQFKNFNCNLILLHGLHYKV